ncbi:A24 family peptidase [Amycolatopsis granulosa]|uniref:A24 family peptidase n=1 Tax=Amycolatopsis granulosa TaxID=185684 RepID=UPI00312CB2D7|nr:leader peptidase (prepilin peptidase)/N-methyltransferase [Amycolatopsis granulosa]
MNWGIVAALGAAGTCAGAATARLLRRAEAPVPVVAVAAGTGAVWLVFAAAGVSRWLPFVLAALAVPLTAADLGHRRLPDVLTLPAYPIVVAVVPNPLQALAGAAVFGGAHVVAHVLAPHAMGAGDVKLAGALGVALASVGWLALPAAAVLAAFVTAVLAVSRHWRDGVPHGPGLLAAATTLVLLRPG